MDAKELDFVFGQNSSGSTPEERALSSDVTYVRSQDQLAYYKPEATGRILTAYEALDIFGFERLGRLAHEGVIPIVVDISEPAATISNRRESLGLSHESLAKKIKVTEEDVRRSEDPAQRSPIRTLEKIARVLGLDERFITVEQGSKGDPDLAIRLRTLRNEQPSFSESNVLALGEASWIIAAQERLQRWLGKNAAALDKFQPSSNYGEPDYPAYQHGYYLAGETRKILDIDLKTPIESMRELCETVLGIPLIQMELPKNVAGATLSSVNHRGIVVNTIGDNENEWVRRVTIAHELGHLLWDPDQHLSNLKVDDYKDLEDFDPGRKRDYVEQRANAFAVEFMAPSAAVEEFVGKKDPTDCLRQVMEHFGLSFISARYHLWNIFERNHDLQDFQVKDTSPTDEWKGKESFAIDFFEPNCVPISRRSKFAGLVANAEIKHLISSQTAAEYLNCSEEEYQNNRENIISIYE